MKQKLILTVIIILLIHFIYKITGGDFLYPKISYLSKLVFINSIPVLLIYLWLLLKTNKFWLKIPLVILIIPSLFIAFFVSSCQLMSVGQVIKNNADPRWEKISEVKVGDHYYTCYRTNGGATTGFGVIVYREKQFLIFTRQKRLAYVYHADDAAFFKKENNWHVQIMGPPDGDVVINLE